MEERIFFDLLDRAEKELLTRPLAAADSVLMAFAKYKGTKSHTEILKAYTLLVQAILSIENLQFIPIEGISPLEAILDKELSHSTQRFASICLLRLLSHYEDSFREANLRAKVIELFDRCLAEDIYKTVHINLKDQTFEKQNKLINLATEAEKDIMTLIASFDNLKVIQVFRREWMQKINLVRIRAILFPFLPRELLGLRFDALFEALEEYLAEEGPRAIELLSTAKELLTSYFSESQQFATFYSIEFLGGLASKLSGMLDEHFSQSPVSKSAQFVVRETEKKYPLHNKGARISFSFSIQNSSVAYAFDVFLNAVTGDEIKLDNSEKYLGHIRPGSMLIEMPAQVQRVVENTTILLELRWTNYDRSTGRSVTEHKLQAQRLEIDWKSLTNEEPYSLEPVTVESELIGREEVLNGLENRARAKNIGSSYIHGQKRVGKTSIVRTLQSRIINSISNELKVIYLEGGDYVYPEAKTTVENLGRVLCTEVRDSDKRLSSLPIPEFIGALSPLTQFLRSAQLIDPQIRILFILDEFDELPTDLYQPNPIADSLFLTIRSISGKGSFGFILVGSEKMEFIISCQGDVLNKFSSIRVDYFDKEKHWTDFQSLVRKPTVQWLDISDDALAVLYDMTSGNPYFTKLICHQLFNIMVQRADSHVTRKEINEACSETLREIAANSFQHFWEDGIVDFGDKGKIVSIERRKVLLAFAEALRQYSTALKSEIVKVAKDYDLTESQVDAYLKEFVRREVLVEKEGAYRTKVALFGYWLVEKGIKEIIITFPGLDSILAAKKEQEDIAISSIEIVDLVQKWGSYRGRSLSEDKVRAWLSQFGSIENQRIMFRILQGVTFYSRDQIRNKMKEAHGIVARGITIKIEGRMKRRDIIVSYLDQVGKSGAQYAKLYAEENGVYYENVIEQNKLGKTLKEMPSLQALVFVDDFIGSGSSACEYFKKINAEFGDELRASNIKIFFASISGFESAVHKVEKMLSEINLAVEIHICDPIDDSAKCFSDTSIVYPDNITRAKAKEIATSFGMRLQRRNPLGFGECQAAIVFEDSCPNNSLPILWDRSTTWTPLFERL